MKGLSPYSIGPVPTFDPCEKCLIKACCSEKCDDKFRWISKNIKFETIKIRLSKRKKRRTSKC